MNNKILKEIWDYAKVIVIAVVLATLISTQVFTFSQVQQRSMEHTLVEKDAILIEKMSLHFHEPRKGEIIVLLESDDINNSFFGKIDRLYTDMFNKFRNIDNESRLVKRVIGLPGDTIDIRDGKVYVNGEEQMEDYVTSETYPRSIAVPLTVGPDELFVLGDNREVSQDSREFGCIKIEQVEGVAIFRVFPFNKIGILH